MEYDIVLTSFDDLRKEFYASLQKSDRVLRKDSRSNSRKSILNGILWWRVVIDEVQMVKNSTSNASKMARKLPRIHSWGVSGTPFAKNGLDDLLELLEFVDQESILVTSYIWKFLIQNQSELLEFLRKIMHRNMKELVKNELTLPLQKESKIFLNLSAIEEYYYNELYQKCKLEIDKVFVSRQRAIELKALSLPSALVPLRSWFLQLRQTW